MHYISFLPEYRYVERKKKEKKMCIILIQLNIEHLYTNNVSRLWSLAEFISQFCFCLLFP